MTGDSAITLPDGRRLGYRCLGDPGGCPLLFFHGTPGSRWVLNSDDPLARIPGVGLVLPERPGYGLSDPRPGRTLSDWADDVTALADHLGLETFAVAGESGGGPHVLACAHHLPHRVTCALVLSAPSPADFRGAARGLAWGNRIGLLVSRFAPGLVRRSIRRFATAFRANPGRCVEILGQQMAPPDRVLLDDPALREAVIADFREAYRQGGDGHATDAALVMTGRSWGFDPGEISVPVFLWHGEEDTLVTRAMAERLASLIPGSRLRIVPGAGHLLTESPEVVADIARILHQVDPP